jgi:hypothetical protein
MLDMVIGAFVALVFLGLPLAIIGLFIASTLDRRDARAPGGYAASREPAASAHATNHGSDYRRRIIYGRYSVVTTALAARQEPTRVHGRKI